jgi:hypothetical protein
MKKFVINWTETKECSIEITAENLDNSFAEEIIHHQNVYNMNINIHSKKVDDISVIELMDEDRYCGAV